ncbi:O-antigen polymerase [Scandinavium lactucae]|jgi:O-antigen polymerase|uniref:O-antigen polymerase n=1 Tax=Scandinavium lactucae TaxID=3095028 RepID=A0ABU4QP07_9ENTR|nr:MULTISPECIES: O-antigen polymerase [unclassified Scandinavium]MDX6040104.1 O-antigen polymerase [Scandinavium sp. V105_6]MDX6050905.1 O-antigen polymerase [Scandinavium sp. V105_1]
MYLILLLLPLSFLAYKVSRDTFNPVFLMSSSYIFVSAIILWTSDILTYDFKVETQLFIFGNIFVFSLFSFCGSGLIKGKDINFGESIKIHSNTLFVLLCFFSLSYIIVRIAGYNVSLQEIKNSLHEIRTEEVADGHSAVQYFFTLIYIVWGYYLIARKIKSSSKILLIVLMMLLLVVAVVSTSKQATFMLFISTFFITTRRKFKSIVMFAFLGLALFSFFSFIIRTNTNSSFWEALKTYLAIYVSSPTIAMQEFYLLSSKIADSNLIRIFMKIAGFAVPETLHREFVYVGVPTNVYTAFSDYVFYGWTVSYIMMALHGFICGLLWKLSKMFIWAKVFYSLFAYTIIFTFFHESLVTSLSLWLQLLLLSVLFSCCYKVQKNYVIRD